MYGCYVTFLHKDAIGRTKGLPRGSPRGDVAIARLAGTQALCIAYPQGKSPGNPNAFLEKALGLPATTRAWNTVVRLVDKHALR